MIVEDLIRDAMRKIGALSTGETPTSDEANDGLNTLNDMLESWQNERLTVRALTLETFTATPGQSAYTVGVGGSVPLSYYPISIESGYFNDNGIDQPMEKYTQQQYDAVGLKNLGSQAYGFYAENQFPLILLKLYPVPTSNSVVSLRVWKPVSSFATLQDEITLPPGWKRAMVYNLAKDLCPEYGQEVPATIQNIATEAKANIKRVNIPDLMLRTDAALLAIGGQGRNHGISSIYSGY